MAVGRALMSAFAPPRNVARRAYGMLSRMFSADIAMAIAATWPIAGAPRTIISRIAYDASPADLQGYSSRTSGSFRWSMMYRIRPSSRNGVRKPVGSVDVTGSGSGAAGARSPGSRIALAASAEARWSAWAAPAAIAAVWMTSLAKARKNRRRPRSAPGGAEVGGSTAGADGG